MARSGIAGCCVNMLAWFFIIALILGSYCIANPSSGSTCPQQSRGAWIGLLIAGLCAFCCLGAFANNAPNNNEPHTSSSESSATAVLMHSNPSQNEPLASPLLQLRSATAVQPVIVSANRINLILVVDRSGSMSGSRWAAAQRGVVQAIHALTDGDVVTIVTFNERVDVIGPLPKGRIQSELRRFMGMSATGGTALYDAVLASLSASLPLHRVVDATNAMRVLTYVVVITDGEDTNSRSSISDVCAALGAVNRLRGFKIMFAGVELPPNGRAAMMRMVAVGDRDISYMDVGGDFSKLFQHLNVLLVNRGAGIAIEV